MIKCIANSQEFKNSFNSKIKLIQVGLNKIFMKDEIKIYLECKLNQTYMQYIVKIQSYGRRKKEIKKLTKLKMKSLFIQVCVRGFLFRKKYILNLFLRLKLFKNKMKMKKTFNDMNRANLLMNLISARTIFYGYIQEKIRVEKENKKKQQQAEDVESQRKYRENEEYKEKKENIKDQGNPLKSDNILRDVKKKIHYSVANYPKTEENNNNISSSQIQDLLANIKKKKKRAIDELYTQNVPQVNQIVETEFIAKIEILTQENDFLKEEKMKLKEQILLHKEMLNVKDQEIIKLRSRFNVFLIY